MLGDCGVDSGPVNCTVPIVMDLPRHPGKSRILNRSANSLQNCSAGTEQFVFFLATGAVIRLLAPLLNSKTTDPGVLVVDEAACFVIPLLSGHEGGANAFARDVAGHLGATPVITTASEATAEFSLADLEQSFGWIPEPAERFKSIAMTLVNREPIAVIQEIGEPQSWLREKSLPENVKVVPNAAESLAERTWCYLDHRSHRHR